MINDDNEKTSQRVQRMLIRYKGHCQTLGVDMNKCKLNYFGMTSTSGAYDRYHGVRGHLSGQSGAALGRLLKEPLVHENFNIYHRVLATPKTETVAYQLEVLLGNFMFVGGTYGLNQAHMGAWRYTKGGARGSVLIFLGWCEKNGKGDMPVAEIKRATRRRALFSL
jgi:hypothetical protein